MILLPMQENVLGSIERMRDEAQSDESSQETRLPLKATIRGENREGKNPRDELRAATKAAAALEPLNLFLA